MASFTFRPAVRENVGLIVGLIGASGSGKTYTAMRLASGIAAGRRFAVIDTEAGRAKHYADRFAFDHGDLPPPFRPDAYLDAILAADAAGYPVIVVDSMSHEHAGEGGLLDWHEEEFRRLGGRDAVKMTAWIAPKMAHKRMVQRLLQVRAHVILCFRAEEKVDIVREDGKTKIVPKKSLHGIDGWTPICEKTLPYELTASFLFTADAPGFPKPIKLQEQHRALFPLDRAITEESGAGIARWAAGPSKDYAKALREAATLADLAAAWKAVPGAEKKALEPVKNERKAQLDAPTTRTVDPGAGMAEAGTNIENAEAATSAEEIEPLRQQLAGAVEAGRIGTTHATRARNTLDAAAERLKK
jgi:hypothetical protein